GPNEVGYIGQLKELYGAYGVSMPAVVPRISATLVEHRVARVAERYDWHGADLFMGARALEQKAGTRANRDLLREVGGIQRDVEGHLRALEPEVSRIERGLVDAGRKTAGKIRRELEAFQRRIVTAQRQGDEVGRAQIEKLVNHVTPEGGLQERVYSPAYYFSMFGLSLAEVLIESLDPFAFAHQVAWLDGSGATA
ncbi:MAG: bacillithiol biosynthesis BshC, partial [Planctomycetes bacterium]|nr:bacillithiol biosynthesis BshC [Planctomycetota bacterium]